ncbi:MAG: SRPBCC family protein [Chloroflexi bacterium]|nr:SRPBCC family protein [Chloroflexota bacterium]
MDEKKITKSITVNGDVGYVYSLWENFETFPTFMENIESVRDMGNGLTHWVMEGPLGIRLEWDAETTTKEPNKRIGWNSKDHDADVKTSGQVVFAELGNGKTEVTATVRYEPNKGGLAGDVVARLFGQPEARLETDLRNFKDFAEGRVDRLTGQES